jgi:hypothetical protein
MATSTVECLLLSFFQSSNHHQNHIMKELGHTLRVPITELYSHADAFRTLNVNLQGNYMKKTWSTWNSCTIFPVQNWNFKNLHCEVSKVCSSLLLLWITVTFFQKLRWKSICKVNHYKKTYKCVTLLKSHSQFNLNQYNSINATSHVDSTRKATKLGESERRS